MTTTNNTPDQLLSVLRIESTNGKLMCDLIDWLNRYPDGNGTTIILEDPTRKGHHMNLKSKLRWDADGRELT